MTAAHPLKTWLKAHRYDVATFAARIGVTPTAVYQWISGAYKPSPKHAQRAVDFTDGAVTLEQFYSYTPTKD